MKFKRECPICKRIIKSQNVCSLAFEDIFKRHLRKHKLYKTEAK